jgi:hypothetical protein
MQMKLFKKALRWWISLTSVAGFFGGWILLAHSQKPVQQAASTSIFPSAVLPAAQNLAPVPSLDSLLAQGGSVQTQQMQPIQIVPAAPQSNFVPVMRTGGSG